jgi:hypothetical protein
MQDWIVPAVAGVLALVALGLAAGLLRSRSRAEHETAALRARLEALEQQVARPEPTRPQVATEYLITHLGEHEHEDRAAVPERARVETALFADLVLRETVVKAASLAHGVRRALEPETRNRIRFEIRREVKRARKQRRADLRQARREWESRQRAGIDEDTAA